MAVGSTQAASAHTGGLTTGAAGSASDLDTDADALNDVTFQKIKSEPTTNVTLIVDCSHKRLIM